MQHYHQRIICQDTQSQRLRTRNFIYTYKIQTCRSITQQLTRVECMYLFNTTLFDGRDIYRVFHDLWTLLQEVIFQVFVIKKVHMNMCPILDGYGVMGIF